jgi:hypothetical protein
VFVSNNQVVDWRDLQQHVARLFAEMEYEVASPKTIELAGRGSKEVDVLMRDSSASVNQIYLAECKWWNTNVPQEVIHAFKTVMEGAGANTGFVIGKKGFQSGTYEAVRFTNIHLLTFEDLQHKYGEEWLRKRRARLEEQLVGLRQAHHLHFDQFNTLPMHNNMFFHTAELRAALTHYYLLNVSLVLIASGGAPKSYLGPEPIESAHPFDPTITWESNKGRAPFTFPTVRDFFDVMIKATTEWNQGFEAIRQNAHESFDALPDEEQDAIMNSAGRGQIQDLPIRVLRERVTVEEYERLLQLAMRIPEK